jgi:hypothetical protein
LDIPIELAPYESVLAAAVLPCLVMTQVPANEALPVLSTKLGGVPDLPPDTAWPLGRNQQPLPLLVQLNFTDLAARYPEFLPWPSGGGIMQLFTGTHPDDNTALVHRDLAALRPTASPIEPANEIRLDPSRRACFSDDPDVLGPLRSLREQFGREEPELATLLARWWRQFDRPHFGDYVQVGGDGLWIQDEGYSDAWAEDWAQQHGRHPFDIPHDLGEEEYGRRIVAAYANARKRAQADGWRIVVNVQEDGGGCTYVLAPPDAAGNWDLDRLQVLYQHD